MWNFVTRLKCSFSLFSVQLLGAIKTKHYEQESRYKSVVNKNRIRLTFCSWFFSSSFFRVSYVLLRNYWIEPIVMRLGVVYHPNLILKSKFIVMHRAFCAINVFVLDFSEVTFGQCSIFVGRFRFRVQIGSLKFPFFVQRHPTTTDGHRSDAMGIAFVHYTPTDFFVFFTVFLLYVLTRVQKVPCW